MVFWPSGLRRQIKALVLTSAGSSPSLPTKGEPTKAPKFPQRSKFLHIYQEMFLGTFMERTAGRLLYYPSTLYPGPGQEEKRESVVLVPLILIYH